MLFNSGSPLVRVPPVYPGQFGIAGSDNSLGLRTQPTGVVLYVDSGHANANDSHDGTNPDDPKATIQSAVNSAFLVEGSIIYVQPGTYAETVTIAATRPDHCAIIGTALGNRVPGWSSAAAATACLIVNVEGWLFSNLYFRGPTLASCIQLNQVGAPPLASSYRTQIVGCYFDGAWVGLYGVGFSGSPGDVVIKDCIFKEFHVAGNTAMAIAVLATPWADPYECQFIGNLFQECDRFIGRIVGGGYMQCLFSGNIFMTGTLIATQAYIDLRGSAQGANMLVGNVFPGDYSNAGGYWDNAGVAGTWVGNFASDLLEAEVGDNGLTIAPPAA